MQKVVIAGGGIAGIEAALALHDLAGEQVEVDLRDPRHEFVFRPFAVGEPYGATRVFRYDLRQVAERWRVDSLGVDDDHASAVGSPFTS
jgi:sulfide:quinone oxidoreductase